MLCNNKLQQKLAAYCWLSFGIPKQGDPNEPRAKSSNGIPNEYRAKRRHSPGELPRTTQPAPLSLMHRGGGASPIKETNVLSMLFGGRKMMKNESFSCCSSPSKVGWCSVSVPAVSKDRQQQQQQQQQRFRHGATGSAPKRRFPIPCSFSLRNPQRRSFGKKDAPILGGT